MTDNEKICLKCQLCCKILHFRIADDGFNVEFFKARGIKVTLVPEIGLFVEIPHVCQHLKNGCAIYDKRPIACQVFKGNVLIEGRCLLA
jgi:Fe-S-cluster containining protein